MNYSNHSLNSFSTGSGKTFCKTGEAPAYKAPKTSPFKTHTFKASKVVEAEEKVDIALIPPTAKTSGPLFQIRELLCGMLTKNAKLTRQEFLLEATSKGIKKSTASVNWKRFTAPVFANMAQA